MDSDSPFFKISRRKTLDVSRLSSASFPTPSKEKRYSMDSNQPPLRSDRTEKLAFIEESLKLLKAEMNPLHQKERQRIRSLTASHSLKDNEFASKTAKWHHKNDTAELRARSSIESAMPPRYQRKHKGILAGPRSDQDGKKSRQPGCATIFFTVLAVGGVLAANFWLVKNYQKDLCERNLTFNLTSFTTSLRDQVYGQHLVVDIVPSLIQEHIMPDETSPLVMAFLVRCFLLNKYHYMNEHSNIVKIVCSCYFSLFHLAGHKPPCLVTQMLVDTSAPVADTCMQW